MNSWLFPDVKEQKLILDTKFSGVNPGSPRD